MTALDERIVKAKRVLTDAAAEITETLMEDFEERYGHEMPPVLRRSFQALLEENLNQALLDSTNEILAITRAVKAERERRE